MRHGTVSVDAGLGRDEAIERLAALLEARGVAVERSPGAVRSVAIRLPVLNFDPALYSRRNAIGLNPFVWLTSVQARGEQAGEGKTRVVVSVDRRRTFVATVGWLLVAALVAASAPPAAGAAVVLLVLVAGSAAWALTPVLVRQEVAAALREGGAPAPR